MKAIIDEEDWGGEVWLTEDQEEIDRALVLLRKVKAIRNG